MDVIFLATIDMMASTIIVGECGSKEDVSVRPARWKCPLNNRVIVRPNRPRATSTPPSTRNIAICHATIERFIETMVALLVDGQT